MDYLLELTWRALANWQAPGFNKPQRSGLIRTCPDRSTGSKPLDHVILDGVSHLILKRVPRGILKRPIDRTARVALRDRRIRRRLAYIEHEHRSHRFFRSIHAAFVWSLAQGNQVSSLRHCARPGMLKSPGQFPPTHTALAAHIHTHDRTEGLSRFQSPTSSGYSLHHHSHSRRFSGEQRDDCACHRRQL
jgi:hypothetical protein